MSNPQVVQVVRILCAAASPDAGLRVPAHGQLLELEGKPGFLLLLLEAYADASADPQGRLLAVLMCKSVVDRHWNTRSGQGMSVEERTQAKGCLLRLVSSAAGGALPHLEELTMVVRKVCRFDFPRQWDELAQFLLGELQQMQARGFDDRSLAVAVVAHHVLKEQASKRLITARRDLHQVGKD